MSGPIDIAASSRGRLSTSPRNQASNLTSALQQAAGATTYSNGNQNSRTNNNDFTRPNASRQDSMPYGTGSTFSGMRPISMSNKTRRESAVGSFMGGMSWGGISVGSWVQDDIMMSGTSPYNFQSPSYHSSSYLPKMEANFWNNLKCCDTTFNDLHELLSHFEDVHSQQGSSQYPYKMSVSGSDKFMGARRKSSTPGTFLGQFDRAANQIRGFRQVGESRLNEMYSPQMDGTNKSGGMGGQDLDTLGEMELDNPESQMGDQDLQTYDEDVDRFSSPALSSRPPPLEMNSNSSVHSPPGQLSGPSDPSTPRASFQGFAQSNPMVSSVNTPTLATPRQSSEDTSRFVGLDMPQDLSDALASGQFSSNTLPFNSAMLQKLQADFGNLDFGNNGDDMLDLCISEPAKALYSENGGFNTQQFPHFNFAQTNIVSNGDENARKLQAHRLASGMGKTAGEEERPFKCPVIGCEKAYKNANGLRYHEKHGHSTQKLKDNGDGSFSIVDPMTSVPYPGTEGMEKEKPYRCDVCGKRYKNLNGLKYHRNHSPPCNPDFSLGNMIGGTPGSSTMDASEEAMM